MVHDSDDAHEQRVAGPLRALQLFVPYKRSMCSHPGQATRLCAPAPGAQDTLPSPSRTSGTETPETQSSLSQLHVPTNVAAPCGIPRGLAREDVGEVTRKSNGHHSPRCAPRPTSSTKPSLISPPNFKQTLATQKHEDPRLGRLSHCCPQVEGPRSEEAPPPSLESQPSARNLSKKT